MKGNWNSTARSKIAGDDFLFSQEFAPRKRAERLKWCPNVVRTAMAQDCPLPSCDGRMQAGRCSKCDYTESTPRVRRGAGVLSYEDYQRQLRKIERMAGAGGDH